MSIQTISIPWTTDASDSIHLQWDDSKITGGSLVTIPTGITSDYNYTGEDREKTITFRTTGSSGPQASKTLKVIQTSDSLVIATYTDVHSMYSGNKAGF
jgi:hypothetical protein